MSTKIFKVVYALTHLVVIKEVMNPSNHIVLILSIYAILTIIMNMIHMKEDKEEKMKYVSREI